MSKKEQSSSVYHILMFAFQGSKSAGENFKLLKSAGKLEGYKIVAQAIVERDAAGKIEFHEPGRGGVGATVGLIAGGIAGALFAPVTVLGMAVLGGTMGGIAGHFAGREIPPEDLKRLGAALPTNSSAFLALVEDVDAEKVINDMKDYKANVVTVTVGDELSGSIAQYVAAEISGPAATGNPEAATKQ
jgi:uncharacterized membrane protein